MSGRIHFHRWRLIARVTPPLFDPSACGELYECVRCGKKKAR